MFVSLCVSCRELRPAFMSTNKGGVCREREGWRKKGISARREPRDDFRVILREYVSERALLSRDASWNDGTTFYEPLHRRVLSGNRVRIRIVDCRLCFMHTSHFWSFLLH